MSPCSQTDEAQAQSARHVEGAIGCGIWILTNRKWRRGGARQRMPLLSLSRGQLRINCHFFFQSPGKCCVLSGCSCRVCSRLLERVVSGTALSYFTYLFDSLPFSFILSSLNLPGKCHYFNPCLRLCFLAKITGTWK